MSARKLTDDRVRELREAVAAGASMSDSATYYGISYSAVQQIVRGITYHTAGGPTLPPGAIKRRARKLTAMQAIVARRRVGDGETQRSVAAAYGISLGSLQQILRKRTYAY